MAAERRSAPRRIASLLALYARLDVLWIARGPGAALSWYASEAIVSLGLVATTFLVAERFDGIGRWSRDEVLFMLGYALLARGLIDVTAGWNVLHISRRIGRGQLDHLLIQPQPLWMSLLCEGFSPVSGSGMAIAGSAVLAVALGRLELAPTAGWWGLLALNLLGSVGVIVAFSYAWATSAFRAPRAAEEINSSTVRLIDELRGFPLDGVGPALLTGLLSAVPVGFAAWYPCRALLGIDARGVATPLAAIVATPLAAIAFGALAAWLFHRGLLHYGRTGSTRYLALGHRR